MGFAIYFDLLHKELTIDDAWNGFSCWDDALRGNYDPDMSWSPLPLWLHQLLSHKNTVLSICLHLSNLDCDRKREHGISPISLSLEKCFVKHNCKKINSQTEQFQDISKWLLLKKYDLNSYRIFCWYLFILHKYEKDWTIFMNIKLYKSQTTNKRAILETRYFAFICCL